jgi:hypothetical protein
MRTNSFLGNFGEEIRNEENKSAMSKAIAGKITIQPEIAQLE